MFRMENLHLKKARVKAKLTQSAFARLLGISPPTVNQWEKGKRPVPERLSVRAEALTKGAITRRHCRPNDWHLIWPELTNTHPKG